MRKITCIAAAAAFLPASALAQGFGLPSTNPNVGPGNSGKFTPGNSVNNPNSGPGNSGKFNPGSASGKGPGNSDHKSGPGQHPSPGAGPFNPGQHPSKQPGNHPFPPGQKPPR